MASTFDSHTEATTCMDAARIAKDFLGGGLRKEALTGVKIRRLRGSDSEAFLRLFRAYIRELQRYEPSIPWRPTAWIRIPREARRASGPVRVHVAEIDDRLIGFAIHYPTYSTFAARPVLHIEDFYVSPRARSRGIARRLLEPIARRAQRMKAARVSLAVIHTNPAGAFWQRVGAVPEGVHDAYVVDPTRLHQWRSATE